MRLTECAPVSKGTWILFAGATCLAVACSKPDSSATRTANLAGDAVGRAALLNEADSNYTTGPERPAQPVDTANIRQPGGTLPTLTIATMTRKSASGRVAQHAFLGRLMDSSSAYPTLGLAPGENFLWKDSASVADGGPWRLLIVPRNSAYPLVWLKRDTTVAQYLPGAVTEPRLVKSSLGVGVCASGCGSGHCATKEQNRSATEAEVSSIRILAP